MLNQRSDSQDFSTENFYTTSVLERLDNLEKKISEFSNKTGNHFKPNIPVNDKKESSEDLEIKHLLFRKLTLFKNKRTLNYK